MGCFAFQWSCVHDIQELGVTACKDQDEDEDNTDTGPADDLLSYDDVPPASAPEPEVHVGSSGSSGGGDSGNGNGNLHLSVTFSPRMEITLRHSPRDEVDDGGGGGGSGGEAGGSGGGGGGEGVAVGGAGIAVGGGGGGGGIDIQFRFTSMDVFEALEHIRERREEQRLRQDRQRPAREAAEGGSSSGGSASGSGSSGSGGGSSSSGGSNGEASWAALPRLNRNMTFSLRNRREAGREGSGRESTAAGSAGNSGSSGRTAPSASLDSQNAFYIRTGSGNHRAILLLRPGQNYPRYYRSVDPNHKIARNIPRLTHYIEEPNVGRGFIKELCFNSDGRLICSPYAHGVRLMMFDRNCSELSTCVQDKPQTLYDVSTSNCHSNCVVSTKFSPTHCLLVSGCLNGKIVWHQPVL